ncbi:MAG: hypothetical protein KGH64_03485 [Candidatus Micrarchaeota archaeon]|nr:hypothetical protein [Candidatus Micrarchaeota archaeon]MDE1859979.1 hypothetical protein [Candidatus Micrarchaeota archaeon]
MPIASATTSNLQLCFNSAGNLTAMGMAVDNGINCFRTDIGINSQYGSQYISATSGMGAQWLGILDYATVNGLNWTLSDWNASVSAAISQYPEIHAWEIWNEPDYFRSAYQDWNATHYYYMMRSASTIIKSKYPNDTVVCFGGAAIHAITGANHTVDSEYQFYKQAWDDGASQYCDAISIHAYGDGGQYNFSTLGYDSNGLTLAGEWGYALNLYENLTHKPIWVTEIGYEAGNLTAQDIQQPKFMEQSLNLLSSYPFVKRIYWFQLANYPTYPWGLIEMPGMQLNPAWYIYINFSQSGVPAGTKAITSNTSTSAKSTTTTIEQQPRPSQSLWDRIVQFFSSLLRHL